MRTMKVMTAATVTRSVNRKLFNLAVLEWLAVAAFLLLVDRRAWAHGLPIVSVCAMPPVAPIVLSFWHKGAAAGYAWLVTALAATGWVCAARQPQDEFMLFLARAGITIYWLVLWFILGVGM